MRRPQRNRLEIYHDIISAIQKDAENGEVKPTRVQQLSHMSYDKFSKYLTELKKENMIKNPVLKVSKKGLKFLQDYTKIKNFTKQMELEFLRTKRMVQDEF